MNAKQKLHQVNLQEWAARFADQKASGLTVSQWCEQNNLSIHKYHYWKHLLKEEVVDQMLPDIVPLAVPASYLSSKPATLPDSQPDRSSCESRANCTTSSVNLRLDGISIELDSSVPEEFLRTLVRAVHYA